MDASTHAVAPPQVAPAPASPEVVTPTEDVTPDRARQLVSLARDVAAVLLLTAATVHLAGDDGGRPVRTLVPVAVLGLALTPLLAGELVRLRRVAVIVVAGLVAGPALSWALAPYRAGGARPLLVAAVAVLAFLAARHLWRRPWGPAVVLAIVTLAVARAWLNAAWAWWGASMGGEPTWLALSWHNQSGALMGAAATAALALVLAGPRLARAPAVVAFAATAAGTWLSGSRGALIATLIGVAVVVAAARRQGWRHLVSTLAVAVVLAAGAGAGLLALVDDPAAGQPLTTREQSATHNLRARVGHAEAAVRMAVAHPLVGTGPGSYRWAARPHYPDNTNLTASAHNEYAEAFGETGLAGGVPVALAALALALLTLRVVRDPSGRGSARAGGVLAAAGAVTVLGVHAGADFDWDYALLAVLLAVGGAVLHAELARRPDPAAARRPAAWAGGVAIAAGAAVAVVVGVAATGSSPAPWSLDAPTGMAVDALRADEAARADAALDQLERWNPGSEALPPLRALAAWQQGQAAPADVVAAVDPRATPNPDQLLAVDLLTAAGHLDAAEAILDDLEPVLAARARWGVDAAEAAVADYRAAIEAARAG